MPTPSQPIAVAVPTESPKRQARRQTLLRQASRMMNRDGAAAVTPAALAAALGLSRNALYHYFRDKEALLGACYYSAAEQLQTLAAGALAGDKAPEHKLRDLVEGLLEAPGDVPVLHDLDLLGAPEANAVRALQCRAMDDISRIFDEGVATGRFRTIDTTTAAHLLLGMADWARLWATWREVDTAAPRAEGTTPASQSAAIVQSLLEGFCAGPAGSGQPAPDVAELMERPVDVLDREAIGAHKRAALLGIASGLFNRRGIEATSIDEIAQSADATKGFVYHHFSSKQALVDACYDRAFDLYDRFADAAEAAGGVGAIESLTWPMHLNAQALLSRSPPLILQTGASRLPSRHRERALAIARRFRRDMQRAIESGVARPFAMNFIELSAGAFFWIPRWHEHAEAVGAYTLGDQIVDLLSFGVLPASR